MTAVTALDSDAPPPPASGMATSGIAFAAAAGLAGLASVIQRGVAVPERAVIFTGALFAVAFGSWLAAFISVRHRTAAEIGLAALLGVLVLAAAAYLSWAFSAIAFRADVLLWSESPYVDDIIKLRTGLPLYGPPQDLSSFFYTPGSQLLTYGLASLLGQGDSIPVLRAIQIVYVALAALLAGRTVWQLMRIAGVTPAVTTAVAAPLVSVVLFLCATNTITNPFTQFLHNDALALLVSTAAFAVLVEYAVTRRRWLIVAAVLLPALGFFVKQSLAIWAPLLGLYLLVFDRPREWTRIGGFAAGSALALAATYGFCRALWGEDFHYWTVTSMGNHPVSPLRVFQHTLDAWTYFAAAIGGGAILAGRGRDGRLLGLWLVTLLLLAAEAYTSGIAWMLNHLGPGSVLAGIWLCGALLKVWPRSGAASAPVPEPAPTAKLLGEHIPVVSAVLVAILAANGLGMVRIPLPAVRLEHERYAAAIEREFDGVSPDRVLLDVGSWVYLPEGVVMKDRGPAVGELGNNLVGDFSGLLARVNQRQYTKILVRDYDSPEFVYEHGLWKKPSGIRDALRANYRVVRVIPGVEHGWRVPSLHPVSVLEPLAN
jgi:hypothetical protein